MNYYPFHIGDFRSGTVNMSRASRWIYRDMLDVYYDAEAPLSLDLDRLCDEIGVESDDERRLVERLLRFKFLRCEDGYHHQICDKVIAEYKSKAETAKANGKKSAATRYQNGEYMPTEGALYAVRISPTTVKVGCSGNMKSRLHQLRGKFGSQAAVLHVVSVSHMGNAEGDLLSVYDDVRDGELIPCDAAGDLALIASLNRIQVAYRVASPSHDGSPTNQEPITNNHEPVTNNQEPLGTSLSEQSPDMPNADPESGNDGVKKKYGTVEDVAVARWIFDRIKVVTETAKEPNWGVWSNDVRLMRERDGRTHHDIASMFKWANLDPFWSSNILSPAKLREKWGVLAAKRNAAPVAGRAALTDEVRSAADAASNADAKRLLFGNKGRAAAEDVIDV